MATHKATVTLTFEVTIDNDLREALEIDSGSAAEERIQLKEALETGDVDLGQLIDEAPEVTVVVAP